MADMKKAGDINRLMLMEAKARRLYYAMFNEIISDRAFAFTVRSKRPPKDPINALISFGNVWLYSRVASEIAKTSLDARIGFLHATGDRGESLNLDIAEIFKPLIVDRSIFTLINKGMMDAGEGEKTPHWSYFGANGWLRTGWVQLGKGTSEPDGNTAVHWSYFGPNGWLRAGWQEMGQGTDNPDGNNKKHWSYFGSNGWLRTGLQNMGKGTSNPDGNNVAHKSYFGDNGWLVTDKAFTYSGISYKADPRGWLSEAKKNDASKTSVKVTEKYTVKFTDGNGKILSSQTVDKGKAAAKPADPQMKGYRFLGWDRSFYEITSNVTVNAKWEKIPTIKEIRQKILKAVNKERKAAGKNEVKLNDMLNETAQEKAEDMCKEKKLDHYSRHMGYFWNQFSEHGIGTIDSGENIALTYSYNTEQVMREWMNSKGHRENILNADYTDIGVGFIDGYWVQQFAAKPQKIKPAAKEEKVYIECPHCHETANKKYMQHSIKPSPDGYSIGNLQYCNNCGGKYYICPECDRDHLLITGTDVKSGVNTYKCRNCGYVPVSTFIESCSYCGKRFSEHMENDEYILHFQYSPAAGDFQEIACYLFYCPKSKRYIYVSEYFNNMYKECFNEMKKGYKTDSEIFKNIFWTKSAKEGNKKIVTPKVRSLNELIDKSMLK